MGHGGSGHKRADRQLRLGRWFAGIAQTAAIGIGTVTDGMVDDWCATLDALAKLDAIDANRIAYIGFSMGTRFGLPYVAAADHQLRCAVLGKYGMRQPLRCPQRDCSVRNRWCPRRSATHWASTICSGGNNEEPIARTLPERTRSDFEAQRDLVFQAWTRPEHLTKWWGPRGFTTPLESISIDLRPGGRFELTMVQESDGAEYAVEMEIKELEPPERFSFSWGDTENPLPQTGAGIATITFADRGDKTEMTFHQSAHNTDEGHRNAEAGWSQSIDRLGEELGS